MRTELKLRPYDYAPPARCPCRAWASERRERRGGEGGAVGVVVDVGAQERARARDRGTSRGNILRFTKRPLRAMRTVRGQQEPPLCGSDFAEL